MGFRCRICGATQVSKEVLRGDGRRVLFCADCGMGMVEDPPATTESFYGDGYYSHSSAEDLGYQDYSFTAEHALLWTRLVVEDLLPPHGRVLDVGCADGFLLRRLAVPCERFGIEVNSKAAQQAAASGVTILARDIADPIVSSGASGSFDVVTSMATLEHLLDLSGAFSICLGRLKPQGVLLFEIPLVSDHRDNTEWFHSSYEHIYYPTPEGIERLFQLHGDALFTGFETDIKGYGSTYVGAATREPSQFARLQELFEAMTQPSLEGLDVAATRLNLAYHVVHCFRPTPERVLALPALLNVAATPNLLKRLTELWHADSANAARVDALTRGVSWHEQQADNWKKAYEAMAAEAAAASANVEALTAASRWHEQQARDWREAHGALAKETEALRAEATALAARLAVFERRLAPILRARRALRRLLGGLHAWHK